MVPLIQGASCSSQMRILINSINYHPELTGIGKYTGEMAEWLVAKGCQVKVVTAPPYYPAWKVSDGYSSCLYRRQTLNGVLISRCPLWVPRSPSGLKRIIHLAIFASTSFPVMVWNALRWKPDLIFVIEPPLFCAFGAIVSAKLARCPSWLHIQDFEVDAAFDLGILKRQSIRGVVQSIERWLMRRFDWVSTISARMIERLTAKGVLESRQRLFENWVDIDQIYPLPGVSALREELNIPVESTVLLYSGNMGKKQGLELIIDAARRLSTRKDLIFILSGDGAVRENLEKMSSGLDNVRFLPLQSVKRLNELLNMADIHLLPQRAGAEDLVMPSKLSNMLASGRPVIATAGTGSQIGRVVQHAGDVVDPGDVDGFVRLIERFVSDPALRHAFGKKGRQFVVASLAKDSVLSKAFEDYLGNINND